MSIDVCRMRVIAHGLLEATSISQQRSVAIAAIESAIKFMRSMGENDVHMPCNGDSDAEKSTPLTGEVCASVVAHMNSQQLLLLVEELLVMLAREPRVGWQRAVLATAHTLCGHIKCEDDAVRVLLLLLYPPQSIDSFVLVDACFVQLLSVCPQAHSPILPHTPPSPSSSISTITILFFHSHNCSCHEGAPSCHPDARCRSAVSSLPPAWWSASRAQRPFSIACSTLLLCNPALCLLLLN